MNTNTQVNPGARVNNQVLTVTERTYTRPVARMVPDYLKLLRMLKANLGKRDYNELHAGNMSKACGFAPTVFTELITQGYLTRIGANRNGLKWKRTDKFDELDVIKLEALYEASKRSHKAKPAPASAGTVSPFAAINTEVANDVPVEAEITLSAGKVHEALETSWKINGKECSVKIEVTGEDGSSFREILRKGMIALGVEVA